MVGLQYLMALARACGVDSHFEPVLPTALGANVVTLSEIARIYASTRALWSSCCPSKLWRGIFACGTNG